MSRIERGGRNVGNVWKLTTRQSNRPSLWSLSASEASARTRAASLRSGHHVRYAIVQQVNLNKHLGAERVSFAGMFEPGKLNVVQHRQF